jgi:hypothetical protein
MHIILVSGTVPFIKGASRAIEFAVLVNGQMPAKAFLAGPWSKQQEKDVARMAAWIDFLAQAGFVSNREAFKKLEGTNNVFEFKAHQLRLFCCFLDGARVILMDGVVKKKDKLERSDVERMQAFERAVSAWDVQQKSRKGR